jgi:transposase InsO family protein
MNDVSSDPASVEVLHTPVTVVMGNGSLSKATTTAELHWTADHTPVEALVVPDLTTNLLSVGQLLTDQTVDFISIGAEATLEKASPPNMTFYKGGVEIQKIPLNPASGLFEIVPALVASTAQPPTMKTPKTIKLDINEAHRMFGHRSVRSIKRTLQRYGNYQLTGVKQQCIACIKGKFAKLPLPKRVAVKALRPFHYVSMDLAEFSTTSLGGSSYTLCLIDHFSGYAWGATLRHKSDATASIISWIHLQQTQFPQFPIKILRSDGGGEFLNDRLEDACASAGIHRQISIAHRQAQNGIAERFNRTVSEGIRTILHDSNVEDRMWAEAFMYTIHTYNRVARMKNRWQSPYKLLYGTDPDISYFHTFGSRVMYYLEKHQRSKLSSKAAYANFIGYDIHRKGFRLLLPSGRIIVRRDVVFIVNNHLHEPNSLQTSPTNDDNVWVTLPEFNSSEISSSNAINTEFHANDEVPGDIQVERMEMQHDVPAPTFNNNETTSSDSQEVSTPVSANDTTSRDSSLNREVQSPKVVRRSARLQAKQARNRVPPDLKVAIERTNDGYYTVVNNYLSELATATTNVTTYGLHVDAEYETKHKQIMDTLPSDFDPKYEPGGDDPTYEQRLMRRDKLLWDYSAEKEWKQLGECGTYTILPRESIDPEVLRKHRILTGKFVLHVKRGPKNEVLEYKTRYVAKGFLQRKGLEYNETHSPVSRLSSIRLMIALAAKMDLKLGHMDVSGAFLNGKLEEDIYVELPPCVDIEIRKKFIAKLVKALYGLKQAGRVWNEEISQHLLSLGFVQCRADPCIYILRKGEKIVMIGLYVDDFSTAQNDDELYQMVVNSLKGKYKIKESNQLEWFLSLKVTQNRTLGEISITQEAYIDEILEFVGHPEALTQCVSTPGDYSGEGLSKEMCPSSEDARLDPNEFKYIETVGKLLYLMQGSRPDIAYPVTQLAKYTKNPGPKHWEALIRLLRYLKGTKSLGIKYYRDSNQTEPVAYVDANHGLKSNKYKPISGVIIMMAGGPISWRSVMQPIQTLSSAEAEFVALSLCGQEVIFLRNLLLDMGFPCQFPTTIYEDNSACIDLTYKPTHHKVLQHVDIRLYWMRTQVKVKNVQLTWIPSEDNIADLFTKYLPPKLFVRLRDRFLTGCC